MTDLTPQSLFSPVPQLETNTLSLAGLGGPMNAQAQALLNRTSYLNDAIIAQAKFVPKKVMSFPAIRDLSRTTDAKLVELDAVGFYALDPNDLVSVDNGGMCIVANDGGRWKFQSSSRFSNQYYEEYGAVNHRFGDRVFMGGAVKNNGRNETVQADFMTQFQISHGRSNGFIQSTQLSVLNSDAPDASNALLVGAQTKNLYPGYNAIGVIGIAIANNTVGNGYAYGGYFEGYRDVGVSGGAYGIEIDTINYSSFVGINPYIQQAGQTIGLQMASGGEIASAGQFDASVAHNIQNNGAKFGIGINFGATSITGTDGVTGVGEAITFAKGHRQQWYAETGKTSYISGEGATPSLGINQAFVDNQVQWKNQAGKNVGRFFAPANSVNFLDFRSSTAGNALQIIASGDDTNIDTIALGKGTGLFGFGDFTTATLTSTGYVQIRTKTGQTVQLLGRIAP